MAAITLAAVLSVVLLSVNPSEAEIVDDQRTSWGLATFGESRVVANFDALGWAVEEVSTTIYAGGNFLDVTNGNETHRQPYLAAFATSSGTWNPNFTPTVGGPVLTLEAAPDGGLFVGGEMDEWNGQTVGALVKIDPITGEMWPGWNTRLYGETSVVRDLSLGPDGWLYAVGTFNTASDSNNPQTVSNVVRMNPETGAIDWSWLPATSGGSVWGISASYTQPTVYIVGWQNVFNGEQVVGLSSTDATQVVWDGFEINYPCCDHMFDVQATPHGTVLAVGEQHGAYFYDENNAMELVVSHVTSYDSRYQDNNVRRGGDFQDIEMVGDRLYASCHCWGSHSSLDGPTVLPYSGNLANTGGTHTGRVSSTVAYDATTGARILSFDPYMSGDVGGWGAVGASDGCLWIAGGINAVGSPGSQAPGRDLVRLCDENGPEPPILNPGPATCVATLSGDVVSVDWDTVANAADYVIYRTVDGGSQSWRGRSSAAPFIDTNRDSELVYFVAARDGAGVKTERTECTTEVIVVPPDQLDPPANCLATIDGDTIAVAWDAVDAAGDYVVYRSVDGGTQYWRGRVTSTNFDDTNRDAQLTYYVAAVGPDRDRSERAMCETIDGPPPPEPEVVEPVASCAVVRPDAALNDVSVEWPVSADPDALYVIYREVDGGNRFWRGRTSDLTFSDALRLGTIEYFVQVKVGNERSEFTACEPTEQGV